MFGLWGKKQPRKLVHERDRVFPSRRVADSALVLAIRDARTPVLVVSFFPASLARMKEALHELSLDLRETAGYGLPDRLDDGGDGWLVHTTALTRDHGFHAWLARMRQSCSFLFVEHVPMLAVEQSILDILDGAPSPQQAVFFVGLDEPLMAKLGGDRLLGLMYKLGMSPDEKLEHPFIDKAIAKGRAKLQKRIRFLRTADTDAEWYERNIDMGG
jgi:hypothetical protein